MNETSEPLLTIAVPTFNMEQLLEHNLKTYEDPRLFGRLEVLCLNNCSEDRSKEIILRFTQRSPQIFRLIDRDSRGYGGSINEAIQAARGAFFRIVDADDWIDTDELVRLLAELEQCNCDVVLTDYRLVSMTDGEETPVRASAKGITYFTEFRDPLWPMRTLPSIHATTYRTALLRDTGFSMQDGIFFVDEEYVILPYLHASSYIYYPFDVYRYLVANPAQSTSPGNRARLWDHREKVLRRLLAEYARAEAAGVDGASLAYCRERIERGVGDHYTTFLVYMSDRAKGRKLAREWASYVRKNGRSFYQRTLKKRLLLTFVNRLGISLEQYEKLKQIFLLRR